MTLVGINHKKVTGLTFLPLLEQAPYQFEEKAITKMIFSNISGKKFLNYQNLWDVLTGNFIALSAYI